MSFADKIGSLISRPNDLVSKDDVPWWLKYAGRIVGTIGSACVKTINLLSSEKLRFFTVAIFFGVWNCTEIILGQIYCFIAGIWQMLAGFFVIVVEAPCCCMFIDFVQTLSEWVDKKPYWHRGAAYILIALPPIFLCINFSSLLGSGFIFSTGVIYGFMALGRKGSREDMAAMATSHQGLTSPTVGQPDHSATLMEDPDVWRPT